MVAGWFAILPHVLAIGERWIARTRIVNELLARMAISFRFVVLGVTRSIHHQSFGHACMYFECATDRTASLGVFPATVFHLVSRGRIAFQDRV